jgi:DNA helicase HerA-like ATPase
MSPKLAERLKRIKADAPEFGACPVVFWDVYGKQGHPVRATVSDMGPLLLARLLNLNDIQAGVLTLVFKIADDAGLLLLDIKDLRAMLQFAGENAKQFTTDYGNISAASIGAIQRGLLEIDQQGGGRFFGEPMLDIDDLLQTGERGRGVINILAADDLMNAALPALLLDVVRAVEHLPVGDPKKPRSCSSLTRRTCFDDAPAALLEKIEQVVKLIRSKGVSCSSSQNPWMCRDSAWAARQPGPARAARFHT